MYVLIGQNNLKLNKMNILLESIEETFILIFWYSVIVCIIAYIIVLTSNKNK